jgi:urease accessory protein
MTKLAAPLALLLVSAPGLMAHPGHGASGFADGIAHPWLGLDHLLAMLAVGILAVRCGGKGLWQVPLSFLACLAAGGLLAYAGVMLPAVELGVALSVLAFGVLAAFATAPRRWVACLAVGGFAILHGQAHVAELAGGQPLAAYLAGFALSTALLHAAGIGLGLALTRNAPAAVLRTAGGAIAAAGVVLLAQLG